MIMKLKNYLLSIRNILNESKSIAISILDRLSRSQAVYEANSLAILDRLVASQNNYIYIQSKLNDSLYTAQLLNRNIELLVNNSQKSLYNTQYFINNIDDMLINLMISNNKNVYKNLADQLKVRLPENLRLKRFGGKNDGGYIMVDNLDNISCVFSLGVGSDVSWDFAMAEKGIRVLQFDPTVDSIPEDHPNFTWEKIGICGGDKYILYPRNPDYQYKTLTETVRGFESAFPAILKIDVEGFEYEIFLEAMNIFDNFDQIIVEFHDLQYPDRARLCTDILAKLSQNFQLVHMHPNNFAKRFMLEGKTFASVLELSFLKKSGRSFNEAPKDSTGMDHPNNPVTPEIIIWNN